MQGDPSDSGGSNMTTTRDCSENQITATDNCNDFIIGDADLEDFFANLPELLEGYLGQD